MFASIAILQIIAKIARLPRPTYSFHSVFSSRFNVSPKRFNRYIPTFFAILTRSAPPSKARRPFPLA